MCSASGHQIRQQRSTPRTLWFESAAAYAVVDGRARQTDVACNDAVRQPEAARIEAVRRERGGRARRVRIARASAVDGRHVGRGTRQRLHLGARGGGAAHVLRIGAVPRPHVVAEDGAVGGGAGGRRDDSQASHVQRGGDCGGVDADERAAVLGLARWLEREQLGLEGGGGLSGCERDVGLLGCAAVGEGHVAQDQGSFTSSSNAGSLAIGDVRVDDDGDATSTSCEAILSGTPNADPGEGVCAR